MWKKPIVKEPEFDSETFGVMDEKQTMDVAAGAVGTCYIAGYTCSTKKGSWKVGTCIGIGYAFNTKKGGF